MEIVAGAATDVGLMRRVNEDALLAGPRVFAVADGMGGHACGDVASALVVGHLATLNETATLTPDDVARTVREANEILLEAVRTSPEKAGMGTTLTGLAVAEVGGSPHWVVFNVGDSRVYRLRDGRLTQVTVDHSEVQELVAAGRITAEEARTHPSRNVVTRSLGVRPCPTPDVWVFPQEPGDCFLLCSDGLNSELDDDEILVHGASACEEPDRAAHALVQAARAAGGRDNITVIVVRLSGTPLPAEENVATSPRKTILERPS